MNTNEDRTEAQKSEIKKIVTNQKVSTGNSNSRSKVKKQKESKKIVKSPEKSTEDSKPPPIVGIPLSFIIAMYNTLLIANKRAHWEPNELIPVGNMIGQLDNIIKSYSEPRTTETAASPGSL